MTNQASVTNIKKPNMKQAFASARAYVDYWFTGKGYKVDGQKRIVGSTRGQEQSKAFDEMWLDYQDDFRKLKTKNSPIVSGGKFLRDELNAAFNTFLDDRVLELKEQLKADLAFDQSLASMDELRRFVTAATGRCEAIDVEVLAHWIWSVKRKMQGSAVSNHLMVIVKGPQGVGKTEAIKKLFEPIAGFVTNGLVSEISDEKRGYALRDNFVMFFDEMQGAQKADVDALKNIITPREKHVRRFHTQNIDAVPVNCSFFGNTNRDIQDLIRDETGMRRFALIQAAGKMDWDTVNQIDSVQVWRSIDEGRAEGYVSQETRALLQASQEDMRAKCPVESWIEERELQPESPEETMDAETDALYSDFFGWCQMGGIKNPPDKRVFGRKMANFGYPTSVTTKDRRKYRFAKVSEKWKAYEPAQLMVT